MAESIPAAYAHNLSATVDPTPSDDLSRGYHPGSTWVNTVTKRVWHCVDPSLGAAVWRCSSRWDVPL